MCFRLKNLFLLSFFVKISELTKVVTPEMSYNLVIAS